MKAMSIARVMAGMVLLVRGAIAQEAASGFSLPVTISGLSRYAGSAEDGHHGSGGFRTMLSPSLQLGSHWFAYAVAGAQSDRYSTYSSNATGDHAVSFLLLQGYLGYQTELKSATILVKAGRLATAFGHYPLEYDDAKSPFIDPPTLYTTNLPIRADQIPCQVRDIVRQSYGDDIQFGCGGSTAQAYGLTPSALYGVPGVEAQISWNRLDVRVQITNSSPANPQSFLSRSQFVQWATGGGYSFPGGLHVGVSGFHGPYLSRDVEPFLPAGTSLASFGASGAGLDAQWFGGAWSIEGEWQYFRFGVPGFLESPSVQGGYVQVKRILAPRAFIAGRSNLEQPRGATDSLGLHTPQIAAHQIAEEIVVGYRINRMQLLKAGVTMGKQNGWTLGSNSWATTRQLGLEIQLVTSLNAVARGFR
jgi:hypothetical protein